MVVRVLLDLILAAKGFRVCRVGVQERKFLGFAVGVEGVGFSRTLFLQREAPWYSSRSSRSRVSRSASSHTFRMSNYFSMPHFRPFLIQFGDAPEISGYS